jgi:hypothetical protein
MASWTDLNNVRLGKVITFSEWNTIFGPAGNMQYLKNKSDQIVFDYYYDYTSGIFLVPFGWPQGNSDNVANTGTVTYPTWSIAGVPQQQYITLTGPSKYICILQVNSDLSYSGTNMRYSTLRTTITDSQGNLNFSQLQQVGYDDIGFIGGPKRQNMNYQIPFVVSVMHETDLTIGFVAQLNFQPARYAERFPNLLVSCELMLQKIPTYILPTNVSTSFILDTTTLNGTSSF